MQFIFWISMGFIFYSAVLYYFILKLVKQNQYQQDEHFKPLITMIICAYNEEKNIAEKLLNIQSLSYPMDKLQVILADDNSSDNTVAIASKFDFVEILELPRCGKTKAQNEAVKIARNEILVFSDANNIYAQDALDKLARNFVDERVGVVCGELHYKDKQSLESTYWKYEIAIKKEESKSGRLIGANGSIYGVRKEAFVSLPQDSISDHLEPIKVYGNGFDVIYEPEAIAIEDIPNNVLQRKRRIILRSLVSMKYLFKQLNPFTTRSIFIPYVSHKLIRWFLPVFLMLIFFATGLLMKNSNIYTYIFSLQIIFYIFGWLFYPTRYFLQVNFASLLAIIDWCMGKRQNTWEVVR